MPTKKLKINRAPVMTLWATIVAERLGYDHQAALTLGKAVTGLNAQAKGRRLGIFEKPEEKEKKEPKTRKPRGQLTVEVLGRSIPAIRTGEGVRATIKGKPISPTSVSHYLEQKFGDRLAEARAAMKALARAYAPKQLAARAYALYEKFRPKIPEGKKGWGAAGELDLNYIRSLAK